MVYGKSFSGRCEIDVNDRVKGNDLCVQAKHTEIVLQHFFNRFYKEYMLALLERHALQTSTRNLNNQVKFRIGKIVIIKDDKPRLFRKQRWESSWCRISCISAKDKENLYDK